jgi:hypothetical protein
MEFFSYMTIHMSILDAHRQAYVHMCECTSIMYVCVWVGMAYDVTDGHCALGGSIHSVIGCFLVCDWVTYYAWASICEQDT